MHDSILFFCESGVVHSLKASQIPESSRTSPGTAIVQVIPSLQNDRVAAIMPLSGLNESEYLLMLTRNGAIKKTPRKAFENIRSTGLIAMKISDSDTMSWVSKCSDDCSILVASAKGNTLRFRSNELRSYSRTAGGVKAMKLRSGDKIVGMVVLGTGDESCQQSKEGSQTNDKALKDTNGDGTSPGRLLVNPEPSVATTNGLGDSSDEYEPSILLITALGKGKRAPISDFRIKRRCGLGVKGINVREEDRLVALLHVGLDDQQSEVIIASTQGMVTRTSWKAVRVMGRQAQGVKLMDLQKGDEIQSVTTVKSQD